MNDLKKALPDGLHEITLEHLQRTKVALADTFLQNNPVWSSFNLNREEMLLFFDRVIRSHLEAQERTKRMFGPQYALNHFIVDNGKINSYLFSVELHEYLEIQKTAKPETLELFQKLEETGKQIFKYIKLQDYPRGTAVFSTWGAKDPGYNNVKIDSWRKLVQLILFHKNLRQLGFRWVIGRISNVIVMKMYQKIGAKVIKEVPFEYEGKTFSLFFFQVDLNCETICYLEASLPQIMEQIKKREASGAKL